jgi:hypothetical protein
VPKEMKTDFRSQNPEPRIETGVPATADDGLI